MAQSVGRLDLAELKALLSVLRDNGVTEYVTPELTLRVMPRLAPVAPNVPRPADGKPPQTFAGRTPEQLKTLLASSAGAR